MPSVQLDQLSVTGLPLTNVKQVKELCDGFRIIGTGTAADDNGITFRSVLGKKRDLGKV